VKLLQVAVVVVVVVAAVDVMTASWLFISRVFAT